MKITLLKRGFSSVGGLEKTTLALARAFAKHGEVFLLTSGPLPTSIPGVNAISFAKNQLQSYDSACNAWLAKNPSEIVFGMERNSFQTHYRAGSGVHAAFLERRRLVDSALKRATFRWNPHHRTILSLEKKCMETTPQLFTNSMMVKNEILHYYNVDPAKIEVVHNGAPIQSWEKYFQVSLLTHKEGPFRFLFVGQGFRRKGLHFLLAALAHIPDDFHLDVVGKDKHLSSYVALANKLGLKKKITFWGSQVEIIPFYRKADCLVLPSIYDPFANVTTEALAMGVFVITSKFNGGSEVLKEGSGLVIEELGDLECLKECLLKALQRPKTKFTAQNIRNSILELDLSIQLDKIVHKTLDIR